MSFYSDLDYIFYCGALHYLLLPHDAAPPPLEIHDLYLWKMGWDYAKVMTTKSSNYKEWL